MAPGMIKEVLPGREGILRVSKVKTAKGEMVRPKIISSRNLDK